MANNQVISEISRQNSDGSYSTFYLGPELKYIGALPNSNNNNIEESLLLGSDKIIKKWHEDSANVNRQTIEFRREEDNDKFYILEVYDYQKAYNEDYQINEAENKMIIGVQNFSVVNEDLQQDIQDDKFYHDAATESIRISPEQISSKQYLRFVDSADNIIDVATKTVKRVTTNDYVIDKEIIVNHLNN